MIIECPACRTTYSIDSRRLTAGVQLQCSACRAVFSSPRPPSGEAAAPSPVVECRSCNTWFVCLLPPGSRASCPTCASALVVPGPVSDQVLILRPEPQVPPVSEGRVASNATIECPTCFARFVADLPGGTAVSCGQCGKVFKTKARDRGDEVQVVRYLPGEALMDVAPRPRVPAPPPAPAPRRESTPQRRWFSSPTVDLIVWFDGQGALRSFRLCYDKQGRERAVTWNEGRLAHASVDKAEDRDPLSLKPIDVLINDIEFDTEEILKHFASVRAQVPVMVARFVEEKLRERTVGVPLAAPKGPPN